MFAKLRIALRRKFFPCEQIIKSLLEDHNAAMLKNSTARERLQAACQAGKVCYNANVKARGHQ